MAEKIYRFTPTPEGVDVVEVQKQNQPRDGD
jgi:hypothetical protein